MKLEPESPQGCTPEAEAQRMPEALVEKVAREMWDAVDADPKDFWDVDFNAYDCMARAAIAVLRPVIRAEALEEAAKVADWPYPASDGWSEEQAGRIAAADDIRALAKSDTIT